jgi:S-(hydroxymethyl)glutathione dehydrogenase/alcohol dehydrogenase
MSSTPKSWRSAILREAGRDLEIVEILSPNLQPGQVLVKLEYSGVCRSQLMEVRGLRGPDAWVPHLLGHEGVGSVVDIGSGVTKVKPGDRVVLGWIKGRGIESAAPVFNTVGGERINAGHVTTFAEFSVVSENRVYRQPENIDDKVAVLFGCALLTGAGMVLNEAHVRAGESVMINGAGGIGLASMIAAIATGAFVAVIDPDPDKREQASRLGAHRTMDPEQPEDIQALRIEHPEGFDTVIDASGDVVGIETAFSFVRYGGGQLLFASHPPAGQVIRIDPHDLIKGRRIHGSWGGGSRPDQDIPRLAEFLLDQKIDLRFMTPRTYALAEVNEALDDLEAGRAMRPLISFRAEC